MRDELVSSWSEDEGWDGGRELTTLEDEHPPVARSLELEPETDVGICEAGLGSDGRLERFERERSWSTEKREIPAGGVRSARVVLSHF